MKAKNKGNLAGISAIIIWSFSALIISYSGAILAFLMVAIIFAISFLLYLSFWLIKGIKISPIFKESPKAYIIGLGGITSYMGLYFYALKTAPIIEANLLNYLWPMLIILFSVPILKEKFSGLKLLGIGVSFSGAALILSNGNALNFTLETLLIYWPAITAAIIWALYSTLTRRTLFSNNFMGIIYGLGSLIMYILHLIFEEKTSIPIASCWPVLILGIMVISYSLWDYGMKKGNTNFIASFAYFIPFFSTLLLYIFGSSDISANILLSGTLILSGCIISNITLPK